VGSVSSYFKVHLVDKIESSQLVKYCKLKTVKKSHFTVKINKMTFIFKIHCVLKNVCFQLWQMWVNMLWVVYLAILRCIWLTKSSLLGKWSVVSWKHWKNHISQWKWKRWLFYLKHTGFWKICVSSSCKCELTCCG